MVKIWDYELHTPRMRIYAAFTDGELLIERHYYSKGANVVEEFNYTYNPALTDDELYTMAIEEMTVKAGLFFRWKGRCDVIDEVIKRVKQDFKEELKDINE